MANIDTSKIEGYADMTAEEKVKALEAYSIAEPDYSGYVKKDLFDKTASELAQSKKDLKARMTEEEIKAKEAEAELLKYKTEAETLRKEKNIASNKAQLIGIGYDEALAQATAEAMENGDIATVIKNQQTVLENAKKLDIPVKLWGVLQKGETVEYEGNVYTPDMVLGPARKGIKVTYCTDSRPVDIISEKAAGSDLFICEGMYGEPGMEDKAKEHKHMTFYEAAKMAKQAEVGELWLTHYSPSLMKPAMAAAS